MNAAKRYAKGLLLAAEEIQQTSLVEEDLKQVVNQVFSRADIMQFLDSPQINLEKKVKLFSDTLQNKVHELVFKLVLLMIQKQRHTLIAETSRVFSELAMEAAKKCEAYVTTVHALSDEQKEQIAQYLSEKENKKVYVHNLIDEKILGGFQVRIKDKIYDASIMGRLKRLEKTLISKG